MTKHQKYTLSIALICFIAAIGFDYYSQKATNLGRYAKMIESNFQEQETEVNRFFDNKDFIERHITDRNEQSLDSKDEVLEFIRDLSRKKYSLHIYAEDELVFWSNQNVFPSDKNVKAAQPKRQTKFVTRKNGYYALKSQKYKHKESGTNYTLMALIPIKYNYNIESDYLANHFAASPNIPSSIKLTKDGNQQIETKEGEVLCYINSSKKLFDKKQQQSLMWMYLFSFFILALFINATAKKIISDSNPILGAAILIISVFGVRLLTIILDFSSRFDSLPLFSQTFNTSLSSSLGDLLINIVLLLWMMFFFHKEFPIGSYDHLKRNARFGLTYLNYMSILGAILMLTWVFKSLIFNTEINFDFDNIFNLDTSSILAIMGIILLLIALFLFSHRMMLTVVSLGLSRNVRLFGLGLAVLTVLPILYGVDFMLPVVYLLLIASVFALLFDLFVDSKSINFTWLVIWLIILSAFPSILLFKYNAYKDRIVRSEYAKELSVMRDTSAEKALIQLREVLLADKSFRKDIPPYPFKASKTVFEPYLENFFFDNNYLFYNYGYSLSAYDKDKSPSIDNQQQSYSEFKDKFVNSIPTSDKHLRLYIDNNSRKVYYLMSMNMSAGDNSGYPNYFTFRFDRERKGGSKVYTELLVDRPYKNLKNISKYDYAVYKDDIRISGDNQIYGSTFTLVDLPTKGKSKELVDENRSDIIYHGLDGSKVLIGKKKEQYITAISLFSYIFGMLILVMAFFAFINTFLKIFPPSLQLSLSQKPSLKNRIQLSVISLIITSFIIIGIVTVWFFQNSHKEYHENRLNRKTESVLKDAEHELELMVSANDSILDYTKLIDPLSKIHRMDINMYDLNGLLIGSSEEDIFRQGITGPRMSAPAFYKLKKQRLNDSTQEEEMMGKLNYKAAYVSLKDPFDNTVAYLGLPYYSKQRALRADVSVFMSTLLNVYVFLLLIAGGIAIYVAKSITSPLVKIGDKIKQFKLGKPNEPLEWKNQDDELGALISEYNKMIQKVEDSAEQLSQNAQEVAWREMAKQVAHEIKNPLTPMKLSIQYLQHAFKSNPDDIGALLKRVSVTMIEQIDNLAHIATEFSNFAKMPRAENQQTILNDLVGSVFDLFSKEGIDMDLKLDLPKEQFFVFADKNHLMRVLNNLIKNAIQAIPDNRRGNVNVRLYKKEDMAVIKVTDNGTGISNDKRGKVFVPNFTTKSSGTGLGLAISKNIIESVNGKIWFDTVVDVGTDFFVELPLVEIIELEEA